MAHGRWVSNPTGTLKVRILPLGLRVVLRVINTNPQEKIWNQTT